MLQRIMGLSLLLFATAASAGQPARFGETCDGMEIMRVGQQPNRMLPFHIHLNFDLSARRYCYDTCARAQSYDIADIVPPLVVMSDVDLPEQRRWMVFDPVAQRLVDEQRIALGPMTTLRHVSVACKPADFIAPAPH
ncbi:hypothetical protein [Sphingobium aquiterrae]|uniref:hypothetical protein n=1 Tax=Sphingobium aquiterrae TaxID=2038656 RepID=UPI00301B0B14